MDLEVQEDKGRKKMKKVYQVGKREGEIGLFYSPIYRSEEKAVKRAAKIMVQDILAGNKVSSIVGIIKSKEELKEVERGNYFILELEIE